jgi:hypothetical protein
MTTTDANPLHPDDGPGLYTDWTPLSWTVRVLYDTVIAVYGWEMTPGERKAAESHAERFAAANDLPVRDYEVSYCLPDPPPVGTVVDPVALQWVEAGGTRAPAVVQASAR